MATLAKREGKTPSYEIQFFPDGHSSVRKTIYLGGRRYSEQTATELKRIVEKLIYCRDNDNDPDKKTLAWLEAATPEIREKLAIVGLIEASQTHTLGELWDSFLETKAEMKDSTVKSYELTKAHFFEFFDENDFLENLSQDRMIEWKESLTKKLAKASVATRIKTTKTCLTWAVEKKWIAVSPLDGIGRGDFRNKKNDRIIPMEEYYRLLDACPCQDWRVIIALARVGGLRCPSEVLRLRWSDVNWEKNRFYVHSSKTEHHDGKESRIVPIFPELKTELETLFFMPESEGREYVVNRYRDPGQNLRTTFDKIVVQASLQTIPRPFDNMRMTRSNEIYNRYGAFKESQWIGHSAKVRQDHYLMIQDSDYTEASQWEIQPPGKEISLRYSLH